MGEHIFCIGTVSIVTQIKSDAARDESCIYLRDFMNGLEKPLGFSLRHAALRPAFDVFTTKFTTKLSTGTSYRAYVSFLLLMICDLVGVLNSCAMNLIYYRY